MNIIVTGGVSGLGGAITRRLAGPGNRLFCTYASSGAALEALAGDVPGIEGIRCDFRQHDDVTSLVDRMAGMDPDMLVHNAFTGIDQRHFHKSDPAAFRNRFEWDILPVIRITQQAILLFRKKKAGRIVTVLTSYLLNRPPAGLAGYVAEKAYLGSLSRSWAVENAAYGITSNCIAPAFMATPLNAGVDGRIIEDMEKRHPLKKLLDADEAAEAVAFLATCSKQINGITIPINAAADFL